MDLVEAWLCARRRLQRGSVKLVQACLCARKDRDSSFHHCGVLSNSQRPV